MTPVINHVKWRDAYGGASMRVSKAQAAENRQHILTAAARLFRQRGVSATGVDAIAEDAGLTHGAVYSQFGSKEVIAAEAIRLALDRGSHLWQRIAQRKGSQRAFPAIVDRYLSRAHRDDAGRGCVIAALGSEVARQPQTVRDALTAELKHAVEFLAALMPADQPPPRAPDQSPRRAQGEPGPSLSNTASKADSAHRYALGEHAPSPRHDALQADSSRQRAPGEHAPSPRHDASNADSSRRYDDALMAFASMAGALILARAVSDDALSDRILKTAAKRIIDSPRPRRQRASRATR
jgi:TetR/AcrR family transcriptional repressor of nem operon